MSKVLSTITLAGLIAVGLPACATKKFVRQGVGEVNKKVDALGQSVEETQERTKRNEGAISDVDKKAQSAQGAHVCARWENFCAQRAPAPAGPALPATGSDCRSGQSSVRARR